MGGNVSLECGGEERIWGEIKEVEERMNEIMEGRMSTEDIKQKEKKRRKMVDRRKEKDAKIM